MTIQSVTLTNFRGFRHHTVALNKHSVLVGHNNAGKTTLIDALRLLAVACDKAPNARYISPPNWLDGHTIGRGFTTTFKTVSFDFQNLQYNQDRDNPAKIELRFKNKVVVTVWLEGDEQTNFVQVRDQNGELATNKLAILACNLKPIFVMPPIAKVLPKENVLNPDTVETSSYGRLAYRHFRNQLRLNREHYTSWTNLLEETWHGLRVDAFNEDGGELSLYVKDPPYYSEIAWVGTGLQAWMQLIWFLCRTPKSSSIILDEPDAFLHADLQRKLIKITSEMNFDQLSIATHSSEIISDVDTNSIIVVKKGSRYSKKPGTQSEVQSVIDHLGSRHNIQLSKLSEARKLIVYEGEDQKFLSEIALKIGSSVYGKFMLVPYFDIAGVQNWHQAIGAAKALSAATRGHIKAHLIIDRDFKLESDVKEISKLAEQSGLEFHCWSRKEIESYFVSAPLLARYVTARGNKMMSVTQAAELIEKESEKLIADCLRVIAEELPKDTPTTKVREHFDLVLGTRKLSEVVSGKKLISGLSSVLKKSWGCQISATNLCRFAHIDELDGELVELVRNLAVR